MDPLRAQQLAAELEVDMMADMYNRCGRPGRAAAPGGGSGAGGTEGAGSAWGWGRHWGVSEALGEPGGEGWCRGCPRVGDTGCFWGRR